MSLVIKAGTTNVSVTIRIIDSTDGTPETGVVWNTAGIDMQYRREGAASTAITEATLSALTDAHSDGGFLHIGNGYYRLDLPDAAVAAGATGVLVHGTVTGMVVIGEYIQLVAYDPFDSVRMGMTALPNAAADAAGGLPISDAGGLDLDTLNTNVSSILTDTGTTLDNHLTDIKGTGFAKDTHSLTNIEGYADLIDDGTSGLAKIATDVAAILVDTGTTLDGNITDIQGRLPATLTTGTADSGTTTTMVDAARTEADNDYWKGCLVRFTSGTISGQVRVITGFTAATDTITFSPATTQAVGTNTYEILPAGDVNRVILCDTTTTNTDMRGTDSAALASELAKVPKSDGTSSWNATALAAINAECDTAISDASLATAAELAKVPKSDGTASWNATALAAINSEVDTSMVTYGLDHLVSAAVADTDVADNSIIAKFADSTAVTADYTNYDWTTDSLRAIRDHIGDGTNLTEAGGTGDHLSAIPWNAAWDAEVESEVNDAIDTAISELGVAAPTATPTLRTGMMLMYMALRNKLVVQTSGTDAIEIYNDAGTKIASKLITDDGSDYTEAEMS